MPRFFVLIAILVLCLHLHRHHGFVYRIIWPVDTAGADVRQTFRNASIHNVLGRGRDDTTFCGCGWKVGMCHLIYIFQCALHRVQDCRLVHHVASDEYLLNTAGIFNIGERILFEHDKIGPLACFERAECF